MEFNPTPQVRQAAYILTAIASPVVAYLAQQGVVSEFWFGLFSVVVTAVAGLAAFNVKKS
jgi:hypothetical protein